ncbi:hypothetical protein [Burkholderia ambifaria]|uniref:hypothetical protein n=1 Tax=Burkholderia ambifaria TaxID=152480 RepID=UPI00158F5BAD|nr:hypothetical protein [Burkholderia ambifaria]
MDQAQFSLRFRLALLALVVIIGDIASLQFFDHDAVGSSTVATKCTIDRSGVEPVADGSMRVKKGTQIACDGVPGRGTAYQVSK